MGPKKYRPRSIVGQGQLYQKSRILDLLGSHNNFFRTFTPNVRITVHLDIHVISCTWKTVSFSILTSLSMLLGIATFDPYTISFILIHSSFVMFSSVKMRAAQKRRTLTARMTILMLIPVCESQVQKESVSLVFVN